MSEDDEVAALSAYLATMPLPFRSRAPNTAPRLPFEAPPALEPATRRAIEGAALDANERYLATFIEAHSFCPFSRGGRAKGMTARFVHHAGGGIEGFFDLMERAASDPSKAVVQVIVPLIDAGAEDWSRFCHELTAHGNDRLRETSGGGDAVFAVAPLHPALAYSTHNPFALIPLFRRAPDPTIQWVRLDAIEALYRGRSGDTIYVDPDDLQSIARQRTRAPLFDRIAETNMKMAARLGIAEIERALQEIARSARARYAEILLGDDPPALSRAECPRHAPTPDASPPAPAILERDDACALVHLRDLPQQTPRRFLAEGVELVVVRMRDAVHVLHGRCPHRLAPLSDAIVEPDRLVCPHHGWDFRFDSGLSDGVPGASVARFRAWISEGMVWVDAPQLRAWHESHVEPFADDDVIL